MFLEIAKANGGKQRNAHLKGRRVTENPPYKRRVPHSSEESSEVEEVDRVSFIHSKGIRPFLTLHTHYRLVEVKYFKQIFNGTFLAKNLTKLGQNVTDRGDSEAAQEPRGVAQLLQCFGVYAMAVIFFADESTRLDLTLALEEYRYRLANYSFAYKFDSLREYNYSFMNARRIEGQDKPMAWRTEDQRCFMQLRLKASPQEAAKPSAPRNVSSGYGICRNFNEDRCTREHCKYRYICLNCQ